MNDPDPPAPAPDRDAALGLVQAFSALAHDPPAALFALPAAASPGGPDWFPPDDR